MRYQSFLIAFVLALSFAAPAICQSGNQDSSSMSLAAVVSDLTAQVQKLSLQVQELQKQVAELRQSQPAAQAASTSVRPIDLVSIGSSKDDVLRLVGKCDRIVTSGKVEFWEYGTSWLVFEYDGLVHGWHIGDHNELKVVEKTHIAPAPTYSAIQTIAPTPTTSAVSPGVAENGSYYGQISDATGKPKTTHVNGYYRKDGTYVRGHYRSK